MKELEFVRRIAHKFKVKKPVIHGIGDDCAVLQYTKEKYMLLTCDMIIEGTHFTKKTSPYRIGWKAMAVNISDIASMGGVAKYALVSAGVPRGKGVKFLKEIVNGADAISKKFGVKIIGGDTNASDKTVLNVTLLGEVEKKYLATRSGAKIGDLIFVTGTLGDGETRHLDFLPRIKEARALVTNFKISSMIDLSDGLAMDLNRVAEASNVGARIYRSLIPLAENAPPPRKIPPRMTQIDEFFSRGEDFELLFTASPRESKKIIEQIGEKNNLPVTMIGEVVKKRSGVKLVEENGRVKPLKPVGFKQL